MKSCAVRGGWASDARLSSVASCRGVGMIRGVLGRWVDTNTPLGAWLDTGAVVGAGAGVGAGERLASSNTPSACTDSIFRGEVRGEGALGLVGRLLRMATVRRNMAYSSGCTPSHHTSARLIRAIRNAPRSRAASPRLWVWLSKAQSSATIASCRSESGRSRAYTGSSSCLYSSLPTPPRSPRTPAHRASSAVRTASLPNSSVRAESCRALVFIPSSMHRRGSTVSACRTSASVVAVARANASTRCFMRSRARSWRSPLAPAAPLRIQLFSLAVTHFDAWACASRVTATHRSISSCTASHMGTPSRSRSRSCHRERVPVCRSCWVRQELTSPPRSTSTSRAVLPFSLARRADASQPSIAGRCSQVGHAMCAEQP
mmetsp:Transcript_49652/g.88721  ORF Transcript_49652/g.88721 Transcript_49652/m.88721 type:complete len:374 (-) Transcript_49652:11-1132(-)